MGDWDDLSHHSHDGDDPSWGYLSSNDEEDPLDDPDCDGDIPDDTTDESSSEIPGEIDAPVEQPALVSPSLPCQNVPLTSPMVAALTNTAQPSDSAETPGAATGGTNMSPLQ